MAQDLGRRDYLIRIIVKPLIGPQQSLVVWRNSTIKQLAERWERDHGVTLASQHWICDGGYLTLASCDIREGTRLWLAVGRLKVELSWIFEELVYPVTQPVYPDSSR